MSRVASDRRTKVLTGLLFLLTGIPLSAGNIFTGFFHGGDSAETECVSAVNGDSIRQRYYTESRSIESRMALEKAKRDSVFLMRSDSISRENIRTALSVIRGPLLADSVVTAAMMYVGTPYRYGATGPSGFDCSGFTGYIYKRFGIELARSSSGQDRDGYKVEIDSLRRGDLVIFGSRRNSKVPGHVGIVVDFSPETGEFSFIHASVHNGVTVSNSNEEYYSRRIIEGRRVLP